MDNVLSSVTVKNGELHVIPNKDLILKDGEVLRIEFVVSVKGPGETVTFENIKGFVTNQGVSGTVKWEGAGE